MHHHHVLDLPIATLPCNESCDCTLGDADDILLKVNWY